MTEEKKRWKRELRVAKKKYVIEIFANKVHKERWHKIEQKATFVGTRERKGRTYAAFRIAARDLIPIIEEKIYYRTPSLAERERK